MQGGIPKRHCDGLRREVLHTYGHEHVLTLASLQAAGAFHLQARDLTSLIIEWPIVTARRGLASELTQSIASFFLQFSKSPKRLLHLILSGLRKKQQLVECSSDVLKGALSLLCVCFRGFLEHGVPHSARYL